MTQNPTTVEPDATLDEAFTLMRTLKVRHLPVVRGHRLLGIVTWTDLMRITPPERMGLRIRGAQTHARRAQVSDVMTSEVVTVAPDTPVELAARTLREHKIGALPVVARSTLVGIVTESDLFDVLIQMLGGDLPGARVSVQLTRGLADVVKLIEVLKRVERRGQGLALVVRLDATSRHGYVRMATSAPLALVDDLASTGLELSEFRVDAAPVARGASA